ncbi:MAG: hypothetical protein AB3N28_11230, partial [Kordiimonas sp.]
MKIQQSLKHGLCAVFVAVFSYSHVLANDDEKLALATEIVELSKVTQALDQIIPAVMQQQSQMIENMSGGKTMSAAQKAKYDLTMKYFAEEMSV